MSEIILYPTETVYGLGVNALDEESLTELYQLKVRQKSKSVSWLVRDIDDIEEYAELSVAAQKIAHRFLPGPLTLIVPLKKEFHKKYPFLPENIGFRVSSDKFAEKIIEDFMVKENAPLTCTSANISGEPTLSNVSEIMNQFGESGIKITKIVDGGIRNGKSSTVVSANGSELKIIRNGAIPFREIKSVLNNRFDS